MLIVLYEHSLNTTKEFSENSVLIYNSAETIGFNFVIFVLHKKIMK